MPQAHDYAPRGNRVTVSRLVRKEQIYEAIDRLTPIYFVVTFEFTGAMSI